MILQCIVMVILILEVIAIFEVILWILIDRFLL